MNSKLTLTIEREILEVAKKYAKEKGQSLSEMVESYLKMLAVAENRSKTEPKLISPRVQKLRGIIKVDNDFDYKETLSEELLKKHGA